MYTMVLMMAVTSGGDVASFGHRNKGCNGGDAACHGQVASGYAGQNGYAGCTGTTSSGYGDMNAGCNGGGGKGGFLGLRSKLFGGRNKSSCHGSDNAGGSCYGSSAYGGMPQGHSTGCTGGVITMPPAPPVNMPKSEDPKVKPKTETEPKSKTESN